MATMTVFVVLSFLVANFMMAEGRIRQVSFCRHFLYRAKKNTVICFFVFVFVFVVLNSTTRKNDPTTTELLLEHSFV